MTAPTFESDRMVSSSVAAAPRATDASGVVAPLAPANASSFRVLLVSLTLACVLIFAGLGGSLFCLREIAVSRSSVTISAKNAMVRAAKVNRKSAEEAASRAAVALLLLEGVGVACGTGGFLCLIALRATRRQKCYWQQQLADREHLREKAYEEMTVFREKLVSRDGEYATLMEEMRRRDRSAIRQQEEIGSRAALLSHAVASANDVVMISDAEPGQSPRVVFVNAAFSRMTGYEASEIIGHSPRVLQGEGTDAETVARIRRDLRKGRTVQAELLNYRKDGTPFWVELNIQPITDETGHQTHWISVQRDVTERRMAAEKLEWQANHDALTCLPNRKLYQDRLAAAVVRAQASGWTVGVLFFDLDRFKQINDTLGHMAGDRLLQQVAVRLHAKLRPDDVIARVGGDEFTVLLPRVRDQAEAALVAQRLLDALHEPFEIDGQELWITGSAGVSLAPQDGTDIETLLKNADVAMYRAKDEGRDSYRLYNVAMNARAMDRLILESHLRRAVDRNEFVLLYQPQVDLKTGRVYGVEALIRWEHPQLGRVSPAQFIPLAEETGLIVEIGAWALDEACRQAAAWLRQGREFRMSVNLSARQFEQKDLTERVSSALRTSRLPADMLDLELTEGTLMRGTEAADTLRHLKALGVRLSVDDFGTGYSSLAYLKQFPLDVLKVDRSFVIGLAEDHKSEAMVRALIELAHGVDLEVIAEGVETEAQRAVLVRMGCNAIQGYLVSPPTTPAEVESIADRLLGSPIAAAPVGRAAKAKAPVRRSTGVSVK